MFQREEEREDLEDLEDLEEREDLEVPGRRCSAPPDCTPADRLAGGIKSFPCSYS